MKLKEHLIPHDYEHLYDQLVPLEQGRSTMYEYIERFNEISVYCGWTKATNISFPNSGIDFGLMSDGR